MNIQDILYKYRYLPASTIAEEVNNTLSVHASLVVTAPPGAGKSTLLPLTMLASLPSDGGKVLMLEPRRVAARQIAERMADMLGEPVGKTVGYRVRFESRVSKDTRIEVLTEGILTRMLIDDATLDGVVAVVFDEFHERSINSDLALALTRQTQSILRPDLKIVLMSATIDTAVLCSQLQAPLVESAGRMFPVALEYADADMDSNDVAQTVCATIVRAHRSHEGDILAFLPGQGEIERCRELLGASLSPTTVLPLYGNLSPEQQRHAIAPSAKGERKVVLATPIAETSVTIEGVRVVVDTGLCRQLQFDARTGLSHLATVRISMDMASQRAGRAGRVAPGVCYRLWTRPSEHLMAERRTPEIAVADLAPMVLAVAAFGEKEVESLPWMECPPSGNVAKAHALLCSLGALSADGTITPMGRRMASLPCHPRIARMMLGARSAAAKALACDIAAILEEKDPLADAADVDLSLRVSALRSARRGGQLGRWRRIAHIAAEYRRMLRVDEANRDVSSEEIGMLVACAYPERIARSSDNIGGYRLSGGDSVRVAMADPLSAYEWLAVASLHASPGAVGTVFLAARLQPADLDDSFVRHCDNLSWDAKQGCVVMQHERRIGKLVVDSKPLAHADTAEIVGVVCAAMHKYGLSMMQWGDDEVARLQRRVRAVKEWHPELALPDLSTPHLLATASRWLPLYIVDGDHVMASVAELRKLRLAEILWNMIPYDLQSAVDRLAPTHIQVPTGSRIRVDYRDGAEAPVLSVRLQECFGMQSTPCVDEGRRPVLMELLSPGFKPVQLTQDLASFWRSAYFEVRKELRRRYPKHSWPENPLEAVAVRGVKKK